MSKIMESEFLSKYKTENGFDEDKIEEDLKTLIFQVALKEQKLGEILEQNKTGQLQERVFDLGVKYLKDRKELAETYIEKIKQTEKKKKENEE